MLWCWEVGCVFAVEGFCLFWVWGFFCQDQQRDLKYGVLKLAVHPSGSLLAQI